MKKQIVFLGVILISLTYSGCNALNPRTVPADTRLTPPSAPPTDPEYRERGELMYHLMAGELAIHQDNKPAAIKHYLEATRRSNDPKVAERATRVAAFGQDNKAAIEAAQRWITLDPQSLDAHQSLSILYLRNGDQDQALAELETLLTLSAESHDQRYLRIAGMLGREKDTDAAFSLMQRLVAQHNDVAEAHYALSRLALQQENLEAAEKAVQKAIEVDPGLSEARVLLARIYMEQGLTDKALETMREVTVLEPDSRQFRIGYARMLAQANRFDDARAQFDTLLSADPDDAELLYAAGLLALEGKQLKLAEGYLKRLEKSGRRQDEARFYLGRVAEERKQYDRAIQWYGKIETGERRIDAHIRIALLMGKKGDVEAARRYLYQIQAQVPELAVRLYLAEVDILNEAKRYDEALEVVNNALGKLPDNTDLYYARSLLAERLDKVELAEKDLRKILDKDPDNAHALNALGYMLTNHTQRYQEAHDYIKRALKMAPNEPAFIDSMGWVQYRLGQHQEAEKNLRRAYDIEPDPEIAAHLGEVLWVLGRKQEAREIWEKALQAHPDSQHIREAMHRLMPK